jgi:hypothetical protein
MSTANLNLYVHLDRWIISDGNYDDFRVGEMRKFALEFWTPTLLKTTERTTSCRQQPDYSYSISGKLAFATRGVSVIDCGVLAYSERKGVVQEGCAVGDFVRGELSFGVDPFFYFESLCKIPGIPALIYEWRIDSMEQDTTPYILSEVCGRPGYVRDESQRSFRQVRGSNQNVAEPRDICPAFLLHCTMLETAPQHKL